MTPEQTIFNYWVSIMQKPRAKLTPKRKSCIKARLKEGYALDYIKQAIDNCSKSLHNMGQNDTATIYNDLTLICRSGDKLEYFAECVGQGTVKQETVKLPFDDNQLERFAIEHNYQLPKRGETAHEYRGRLRNEHEKKLMH